MALNTLEFNVKADSGHPVVKTPVHVGVVGSGDMEVLFEPGELNGFVAVKIVTPVSGFDDLWKRVLESFVVKNAIADARIEINDNNATPAVVLLRLQQALSETSES